MKFSSLTERVSGDGIDAWAVHYAALARRDAGEEVIVMSVGQENDEVTPPHIVEAATASLRAGRHHYTPVNGNLDLRRALARHHRARTGQVVDENHCAIFAGAQNALFALAQCLLEHGDEVILSEPYYTTYPATFSNSGAALVCVPASFESGFQIDAAAISAAVTERTRAIVINSPSNPAGAICAQKDYEKLLEICLQKNIWLICDDVYCELLHPHERTTAAALPGAERVCITVSSLSKSHRMTGWRLGWAVGPHELTRRLYDLAMCMSYGLPAFIQDAALAALEDDDATAHDIRAKLDRRREVLRGEFSGAPGMRVWCAPGCMFALLDISALPVSAKQFAEELLARHDVAILPCDGFGASCANFLRVSLSVDEPQLGEACRRIAAHARSLQRAAA
ncbi:MAG: pyridoxal phosphate-dependent aminotransferase [Gammaproteobacteria bacterium]|nr:pyridoxal phosphate-dependent aminotransferase [Gammaproteobacteria bacterium]